ncbi:MAG TPA: ABATE domain-containing protein [Bryobacteraceae bacterium]|jgi:predicted RNA-binding Zn ribbon-like protein
MRLLERPVSTAKLLGGRLCLDFVNTCGGRGEDGLPIDDRLLEYTDLAAWAARAGLESGPAALKLISAAMHDSGAAAKVWERAVALREACYRLLTGKIRQQNPAAADVAILNGEWVDALRHRALATGPPYLRLKWTGSEQALDRTLWAVAESAVQLLASSDSGRLRECGGPNCGWLFEDVSRNGSRQWCDMQMCGNLAKVRRFRERQTCEK